MKLDYLNQFLGTYILEARKKLGMNQIDLARALGFSAQFLGRIEKGEIGMPKEGLIKTIEVLCLNENKLHQIYRMAGKLGVQDLFRLSRGHKKKTASR